MLRGLGDRVPLDQYIFAAKFVLRIASFRRVAVRLHAVVKIEKLGSVTDRRVDLLFRPYVKRAFGLPVAGILDPGYNGAVSVLRREISAFL